MEILVAIITISILATFVWFALVIGDDRDE